MKWWQDIKITKKKAAHKRRRYTHTYIYIYTAWMRLEKRKIILKKWWKKEGKYSWTVAILLKTQSVIVWNLFNSVLPGSLLCKMSNYAILVDKSIKILRSGKKISNFFVWNFFFIRKLIYTRLGKKITFNTSLRSRETCVLVYMVLFDFFPM